MAIYILLFTTWRILGLRLRDMQLFGLLGLEAGRSFTGIQNAFGKFLKEVQDSKQGVIRAIVSGGFNFVANSLMVCLEFCLLVFAGEYSEGRRPKLPACSHHAPVSSVQLCSYLSLILFPSELFHGRIQLYQLQGGIQN